MKNTEKLWCQYIKHSHWFWKWHFTIFVYLCVTLRIVKNGFCNKCAYELMYSTCANWISILNILIFTYNLLLIPTNSYAFCLVNFDLVCNINSWANEWKLLLKTWKIIVYVPYTPEMMMSQQQVNSISASLLGAHQLKLFSLGK